MAPQAGLPRYTPSLKSEIFYLCFPTLLMHTFGQLKANDFLSKFYKIQSNLGYTNLSCTKSWIIRIFCPVPAKSPLSAYIKSLSYTSLSYTKPGLYDRYSRSQPKMYLVYTNFRYGLKGKIAHFSAFSLFCFNSNADFFFVNLRFYVNCLLFYGIVHQGHNTVKSQCRRQGSIPNRWDVIKLEVRLVFPYNATALRRISRNILGPGE